MTAPDPTAGERVCDCGHNYGCAFGPGGSMRSAPASPPAVAASTGTSEDVEALAKVLVDLPTHPEHYAQLILASDWLAAHDATTADRVRRETADGIADALEQAWAYGDAARIAREQAR